MTDLNDIFNIIDKLDDKKYIIKEIIKHYNLYDLIKIDKDYDEFEEYINNNYIDSCYRFKIKKFYNDYFHNLRFQEFKQNFIDNDIIIQIGKSQHYRLKDFKALYDKYFIKDN